MRARCNGRIPGRSMRREPEQRLIKPASGRAEQCIGPRPSGQSWIAWPVRKHAPPCRAAPASGESCIFLYWKNRALRPEFKTPARLTVSVSGGADLQGHTTIIARKFANRARNRGAQAPSASRCVRCPTRLLLWRRDGILATPDSPKLRSEVETSYKQARGHGNGED